MASLGVDTGVRIRGFELWVNRDEEHASLRTAEKVAAPHGGMCRASRSVKAWRDGSGAIRTTIGPCRWGHGPDPFTGLVLTESEALEIEAATDGPAPMADHGRPVPGMVEIAAACEAEGTPLAPIATLVRPTRRCVECGSLVYGEYCTHCFEG